MVRPLRKTSGAALAFALALALAGAAAQSAPMQNGGDTRDVGSIPRVLFEGPVKVRPGESGVVAFTVQNRYNETMSSVHYELAFKVGGDWLEAHDLNGIAEAPAFSPSTPLPRDLASGETMRVTANFTTKAGTTPGVYLVSFVLDFSYANATGRSVPARFASLGSLPNSSRPLVNLSDYNGTIAALGLDGFVPDTSVQVEGGGAEALWWWAAGFGAAAVAAGTAYGWASGRGEKGRRR